MERASPHLSGEGVFSPIPSSFASFTEAETLVADHFHKFFKEFLLATTADPRIHAAIIEAVEKDGFGQGKIQSKADEYDDGSLGTDRCTSLIEETAKN
jgi:hypothetical protein